MVDNTSMRDIKVKAIRAFASRFEPVADEPVALDDLLSWRGRSIWPRSRRVPMVGGARRAGEEDR